MKYLNAFAYWFINIGWWIAVLFAIAGGVVLSMQKPAESYVSYHKHCPGNGYSCTWHQHNGGNISHRH